jgi:DNA-binding response OmpR family regulator
MPAKILVADDEANIVKLLRMYLREEGYDIVTARDGRDAIERFRAEDPDLVLLDLMMPELGGFEVCTEIRKSSDVPVIMLTARSDDVDKIVGLEMGADDYITKPFNPREVVARVKANLRRRDWDRTADATAMPGPVTVDDLTLDPSPAATWSSPASACACVSASSTCWRRSCAIPTSCSIASACSPWSGARTSTVTRAPLTYTWRGFARS